MYIWLYSEKRKINAAMMTKFIMQKGCATIAITSTVERRNHGIAHTTNFMQQECVRTAI